MGNGDDQQKWDQRYQQSQLSTIELTPCHALLENQHLLPASGASLDLACGLGANALFLAQTGLQSHAWDISAVAIDKLQEYAVTHNIDVHTQVRDVVSAPPRPNQFDVIVVSRFLQRSLFPAIIDAIKPGGLLVYQTFSLEKSTDIGPSNPVYLLGINELLDLCCGMRIVVYREEAGIGLANEAMIVAQRRVDS